MVSMGAFPLTEPEDSDYHTVFADTLLLSPGTEDYKIAPSIELIEHLRRWLSSQPLNGQ